MRIGEFAEAAELSTRQIRYYTDMGLLPARRLPNGYRDYDPREVGRARRIHSLFAIGLTSAQVQRLSPCLAEEATTFCDATREALARQLARMDEQIGHLQMAREAVARQLETADLPA